MVENLKGVLKLLLLPERKVTVTNHNQIKNLAYYKGALISIDYPFQIESEDSENFLNYVQANARLDSMKLKLNEETVTN